MARIFWAVTPASALWYLVNHHNSVCAFQAHLELHVGPVHVIVIGVLEALHRAAEVSRGVLQLVRLEPVGAEPGEVPLGQRHLLNGGSPGVLIPQVLVVDPGCTVAHTELVRH